MIASEQSWSHCEHEMLSLFAALGNSSLSRSRYQIGSVLNCLHFVLFFLQRKRKPCGALTPGQITGLRFLIQRPLRWCKQICFWFRKSRAFFFPSAVTAKLSVHISLLRRVRFTQSSGGITSRLRHSPLPPPPPLLGLLLLASCPSGDFSRGVSHALQQGSVCSWAFLFFYFFSLQLPVWVPLTTVDLFHCTCKTQAGRMKKKYAVYPETCFIPRHKGDIVWNFFFLVAFGEHFSVWAYF